MSSLSENAFAAIQVSKSLFDNYTSVVTAPYVVQFKDEDIELELKLWFSDFGKEEEYDVWKTGRQRWEFEILSKDEKRWNLIVVYCAEKQLIEKYETLNDIKFICNEMLYKQNGVLTFKDKTTADTFASADMIIIKLMDSSGRLVKIEIPNEVLREWQSAAKVIKRKETAYNRIIDQFKM